MFYETVATKIGRRLAWMVDFLEISRKKEKIYIYISIYLTNLKRITIRLSLIILTIILLRLIF